MKCVLIKERTVLDPKIDETKLDPLDSKENKLILIRGTMKVVHCCSARSWRKFSLELTLIE